MDENTNVLMRDTATYLKDLAERTVWTFLEAGAAVAFAAGPAGLLSASMWQTAAAAGLAAAGTLLKGLAARYVGSANSASTVRGV